MMELREAFIAIDVPKLRNAVAIAEVGQGARSDTSARPTPRRRTCAGWSGSWRRCMSGFTSAMKPDRRGMVCTGRSQILAMPAQSWCLADPPEGELHGEA